MLKQQIDMLKELRHAPSAALAFAIMVLLVVIAIIGPLVIAENPFDLMNLDIMAAYTPPLWLEGGDPNWPLGTDDQGRNMLTAMIFGLRTSLLIGFVAVIIGMVFGVTMGLISGYAGGMTDAVIMRIADVQLAYPALLVAMIIDGVARAIKGGALSGTMAVTIVILSIGLSFWVQYARTVRSSVMIERNLEYVQAARVTGLNSRQILVRHILPNIFGPVLVIATINLAIAIITEATLSFLGVGIPLTQPSLGTLIRNGNTYLNSGEWWIAIWPCLLLVVLVVAVNVFGDWMRDYMNPKLRRRA